MKKKILLGLLACLLIIPFSLAACSQDGASTSNSNLTGGDNWWDKWGEPEYGGTITLSVNSYTPNFDTWMLPGGEKEFWLETLFQHNWTLDRNIWGFNAGFVPDEYWVGSLAEDWEQTDPTTITVSVRQGIYWQNIAPVNGREFTAYDVQAHYNRMLGQGDYTEPAPMYAGLTANWDSVSATDDYTVVFKFKNPSAMSFQSIADPMVLNAFEAPEVAAMSPEGGNTDPAYAIGTGPWLLGEYVPGTSISYNANHDYWGTDARHPDNAIPYVDTLKILFIADPSSTLAALRTGKIDILPGETLDWQQVETLSNSNPELETSATLLGEQCLLPRSDTAPFTDIRVRKAMQMAINREEIAQTYYGGTVDGKPAGYLSPSVKGYAYAYDDWPQELKDEYAYNPDGAKQLLAEAAADGIFEVNDMGGFDTNILISSARNDVMVMQIMQSELKDIGVDMEIEVMEDPAWEAVLNAGKQDQMAGGVAAQPAPPHMTITTFDSRDARNWACTKDSYYDSLVDSFNVASTPEEARQIRLEADKYAIEQHWMIVACPYYGYNAWQPYLKGYSGEALAWGQGYIWARLWIGQ